LILFSCNQN